MLIVGHAAGHEGVVCLERHRRAQAPQPRLMAHAPTRLRLAQVTGEALSRDTAYEWHCQTRHPDSDADMTAPPKYQNDPVPTKPITPKSANTMPPKSSAPGCWNKVSTSFRAIPGEASVSSPKRLSTRNIDFLPRALGVARDHGWRILTIKD
jgi:hypothetical protein